MSTFLVCKYCSVCRAIAHVREVNNAGFVHGVDRVGSILDSDAESMFATNVLGLISITQLLIKGSLFGHRISSDLTFLVRL